MKPIRKLGGTVGSVVAAIDLAWTAYELFRLALGKNVLIEDAFEFFRRHPEHLPGIYLALAAAGIVLLLISNAAWVARYLRQRQENRPENRFRAMTTKLEIELFHSNQVSNLLHPLPGPERYIERSTIYIELADLGVRAPDPNADNAIFVRFLTNIIPFARKGDLQNARELAKLQSGKDE